MADSLLMFILDGVGDRPEKDHGSMTPLEMADTPNLDDIASRGINGQMDTIAPGIRPGSDTGHLALLGYNPYQAYTGRGPFEAAGLGIEVESNEVAFRCNFGTVEEGKVIDRRAERIKEGTKELAQAIDQMDLSVDFLFKEGVEHRAVLILKGKDLGDAVSDVDPHEVNVPYHEAETTEEGGANQRTTQILNEFTERSKEILSQHPVNERRKEDGKPPANIILSRGAGVVPDLDDLEEKTSLQGAAISGIPLVRGVCRLAGLDIIDVQGATGGLETDISQIISETEKALKEYDLVLVNIKGFDLSGHDGDFQQKVDFIEKVDAELTPLKEKEDVYGVVTGDHSTPVSVMGHSGDPLPLTVFGEGVRTDDVESYDERSCAKGGLGRLTGGDLLNILLDLSDRAEKFGA